MWQVLVHPPLSGIWGRALIIPHASDEMSFEPFDLSIHVLIDPQAVVRMVTRLSKKRSLTSNDDFRLLRFIHEVNALHFEIIDTSKGFSQTRSDITRRVL